MLTLTKKTIPEADRIVRLPEVLAMTGVSESTIARWEQNGEFPGRVRIGIRCVGWRVSEITRWITSRNSAIDEKLRCPNDG